MQEQGLKTVKKSVVRALKTVQKQDGTTIKIHKIK